MIWRIVFVVACNFVLVCGCNRAESPSSRGQSKTSTKRSSTPGKLTSPTPTLTTSTIYGAPTSRNSVTLVGSSHSVTVNPLFFGKRGGKFVGLMGKAQIKITPNSTDQVSIGVFEQFAGGAGNQWRSAVSMAAFLSSLTLGKLLTDFQFSVHCGGKIDGPSAGGLLAAGMIAAMTGASVNPAATMTGTVNPDGTIGPVGGIPQKFTAAAQKGKKILGYPVGQRLSVDLVTRQEVDLVALAARYGATAVEIKDVYDAYKLITGKTIPRPIPLDASKLGLQAAVSGKLRQFSAAWLAHTQRALLGYQQTGDQTPMLQYIVQKAREHVSSANLHLAKAQVGAAYQRALESAVYSTIAVYGAAFELNMRQNNLNGIFAELDKLANTTKVMDNLANSLKAITPRTMNEFMGLIFAHSYVIQAISTSVYGMKKYKQARKLLQKQFSQGQQFSPEHSQTLRQALFLPTFLLATCYIASSAGRQMVEISRLGGSRTISFDKAKLSKIAQMFSSAANTTLQYYDALIIEPLATRHNKSMDFARNVWMDKDLTYLTARLGMGLGRVAREKWGDTLASEMAVLAASLMSYLNTAMLVNKAYSLRVKVNSANEPVSLRSVKAFTNMLRAAERRARENAAAALAASGVVPVGAKMNYLAAMAYKKGPLSDQLQALSMFWTSSMISQLAVMLVR